MIYFHVAQYRGQIFGFCVSSICNFDSNLVLHVSTNLLSNPPAYVVLMTAALGVKLFLCSELFARKNKHRWRVVLRESIKYNCSFL